MEELLKKFPAAIRAKAEELKAFNSEIKKECLEEELSKLPHSAYVITHLIEFAQNHRSAMKLNLENVRARLYLMHSDPVEGRKKTISEIEALIKQESEYTDALDALKSAEALLAFFNPYYAAFLARKESIKSLVELVKAQLSSRPPEARPTGRWRRGRVGGPRRTATTTADVSAD